MTYICGDCGQEHGELSRYTMWRRPELTEDERKCLVFDTKFTCRVDHERHFVSCEVEVPFQDSVEPPLGFICWVEVSEPDYARYSAYRGRKKERGTFKELVSGRLANNVPAVSSSIGTQVKFKVLKGDPTPYVRWVDPDTALARRISLGANKEFWHEAVGLLVSRAEG